MLPAVQMYLQILYSTVLNVSPTKTSFLHTSEVTLSFPSSVIDNVYLETGVDKSPYSFETVFFRNDITFLAAKVYSDEVCEVVLAMVTESETEAVESAVGTTRSEAK